MTSLNILAQNQNNFEISKSLDVYTSLLRELNLSYVDEINPAELNEIAIKSMLQELDPYTVFVPEAEIENFQLMTTGEYGGIGSLIQLIDGKVTITEPYEAFLRKKPDLFLVMPSWRSTEWMQMAKTQVLSASF